MREYRTKQINFRVTESEYARINERMQEAGIKHPSAYLRKMAMDGYILKLDLGDLQEIQRLARINSNNINQIAKRINPMDNIYEKDMRKFKQKQEEISQDEYLLKIIEDILENEIEFHRITEASVTADALVHEELIKFNKKVKKRIKYQKNKIFTDIENENEKRLAMVKETFKMHFNNPILLSGYFKTLNYKEYVTKLKEENRKLKVICHLNNVDYTTDNYIDEVEWKDLKPAEELTTDDVAEIKAEYESYVNDIEEESKNVQLMGVCEYADNIIEKEKTEQKQKLIDAIKESAKELK